MISDRTVYATASREAAGAQAGSGEGKRGGRLRAQARVGEGEKGPSQRVWCWFRLPAVRRAGVRTRLIGLALPGRGARGRRAPWV